MGSSGRDYFREDDPYGSSWSPGGSDRPPMGIAAKVAIVVALLFLFAALFSDALEYLALSREALSSGYVWTLLTYGFATSPYDLLGVVFACLIIYQFGVILVGEVGPREFLLLLICATLFAGVSHVLVTDLPTMGAHLLADVIVLWLGLRVPKYPINLFGLVTVPMWGIAAFFVGLPLVFSLLSMLAVRAASLQGPLEPQHYTVLFTAYFAALCFTFLHERLRLDLSSLLRVDALLDKLGSRVGSGRPRSRAKLRVYADDESDADYEPAEPAPTPAEEAREAEVDRILQKIHDEGEASLTGKERRLLASESRRLRKRR